MNFREFLRETPDDIEEAWSGKERPRPGDRDRSNDSAVFDPDQTYEPTDRDIRRMLNYYEKNSDPKVIALVTNVNKAIARVFIAAAIGWTEAAEYYEKRARELGADDNDIDVIYKQAKEWDVPEAFELAKRKKDLNNKRFGNTAETDKLFASRMGDFYKAVCKAKVPRHFKIMNEDGVEYYQITVYFAAKGKCVINVLEKDMTKKTKERAWEIDPDLTDDEIISSSSKHDWKFFGPRGEFGKIDELVAQWEKLVAANNA